MKPSQLENDPRVEPRTMDDYWLALYRNRWIILLVAAASGGFAWWLSGKIAPRYEATASFYVPGDAVRPGSSVDDGRPRLPGVGLGDAKGYAAHLQGGDATRQIASEFPGKTPQMLRRDVDFVVSRQGIIGVYARDTEPERAAAIANRYVSYFNEFHAKMIREGLSGSLSGIQRERELVLADKQQREQAIEELERKHQIASLEDELKELEAKRTRQADRIKDAEAELLAARQRVDVFRAELAEEDEAYREDKVVLDGPLISELRQTMVQAEVDLAQKEVELQPAHPEVKALHARLELAKGRLEEEMLRVAGGTSKHADSRHTRLREDLTRAEVELAVATARLDAVRVPDNSIRERAMQIPAIMRERNQLRDQIDRDRLHLSSLDQAHEAAQMELMRQRDTVVVTQRATAPHLSDPVYPIPILNSAVATFAGLIVGVLYSLLLNHIDERARQRRHRRLTSGAWIADLLATLPSAMEKHRGAGAGNGNGNGSGNGHRTTRAPAIKTVHRHIDVGSKP